MRLPKEIMKACRENSGFYESFHLEWNHACEGFSYNKSIEEYPLCGFIRAFFIDFRKAQECEFKLNVVRLNALKTLNLSWDLLNFFEREQSIHVEPMKISDFKDADW